MLKLGWPGGVGETLPRNRLSLKLVRRKTGDPVIIR